MLENLSSIFGHFWKLGLCECLFQITKYFVTLLGNLNCSIALFQSRISWRKKYTFPTFFQAVPFASRYSNSTIGLSIHMIKQNSATIGLVFLATLPELILLSRPLEELDLNEVPFSTMALLAGRIPTLMMTLGLPLHMNISGEDKHKAWINSSLTMKFYRHAKKSLYSEWLMKKIVLL